MKKFLLFFAFCAGLTAADLEDGLRAFDEAKFDVAKTSLARACDDGKGLGCAYLGLMNQLGKGMVKDSEAALKLYEKGCALNDAKACSFGGGAYLAGDGATKDIQKALSMLTKGCDLGESNACNDAGGIYLERQTREDQKIAANFFERSCNKGNELGCQWGKDLTRSPYFRF